MICFYYFLPMIPIFITGSCEPLATPCVAFDLLSIPCKDFATKVSFAFVAFCIPEGIVCSKYHDTGELLKRVGRHLNVITMHFLMAWCHLKRNKNKQV